jgi:hypothetical protein
MVKQPAALFASSAGGRTATRSPAGLNQGDVEVRSQLLEPANQAATRQPCTDNGEINLSHER